MHQKLWSVAFLLLMGNQVFGQSIELNEFIGTTKSYIDFRSQPSKDPKNYQKQKDAELKKLNQSFVNYARSLKGNFDESNGYKSMQNNQANKLFNASNFLELNAWSLSLNGAQFSFVAYNIIHGYAEQKNFVIINELNGNHVFIGNNEGCYIDWIQALDENHVIVSLHQGELGMSRKIMVLNTSTSIWKPIKAFKGTTNTDQARFTFILESSFEGLLGLPQNANQVFFNPTNKELYYFKHIENKKIKVSASWKNKLFILDDYTIESNDTSPVAVPVER